METGINREKNIAQVHIDQLIEKALRQPVPSSAYGWRPAGPSQTEIIITLNLYGPVDFSALKTGRVNKIVFKEKGGITSVTGLPPSLVVFECEKQRLTALPNFPPSIEVIRVSHNAIKEIDLGSFSRLKVFDATNCQIEKLIRIPKSIQELRVNDNAIKRLDLEDAVKLHVFHCLRNRMLRIDNVPASIVDLQVEDGNPLVKLDYEYIPIAGDADNKGVEPEYMESLDEYFRLKSKYETDAKEMRERVRVKAISRKLGAKEVTKMVKMAKPLCVNCRRPVGSIFKRKKGRLVAYCGDTSEPCPFKVELYRGNYLNNQYMLYLLREQVHDLKETIIQKKMDTLFGYVDEQASIGEFKVAIENYRLDSSAYKEHLERWNSIYYSDHKKDLIKGKLQTIHEIKGAMNANMAEYERTGNHDIIHSVMNVYVKEYLPEVHNLRRLNYEIVEMENGEEESRLIPHVAGLQTYDLSTKEIPRVITFTTATVDTRVAEEPAEPLANEEPLAEPLANEEPLAQRDV